MERWKDKVAMYKNDMERWEDELAKQPNEVGKWKNRVEMWQDVSRAKPDESVLHQNEGVN